MTELCVRLDALCVFRALLCDPVISALHAFLKEPGVGEYAEFVSRVYKCGAPSFAEYVKKIVGNDENPYITAVGRADAIPPELAECVERELETLQLVSDITPALLCRALPDAGALPKFPAVHADIKGYYLHRVENVAQYGYGMYAKYRMFYINPQNAIVPVRNPDKVSLEQLVDYKREQGIIMENTRALLRGKPAANILLTGDAGCGKSSTVKAVVNALWGEGLRILQVQKEQLRELPGILDELSENPLKFIIFIDDLSFTKSDDNYSALKAILEGSVSAKADNVVIYATSNRRHLVRESFSQREGDDVHANDTVQEIVSLSERFGIQITFKKPSKDTYIDIVKSLCERAGVVLDAQELVFRAEQYALSRGGRSPRAATQFVNLLIAEKESRD